MRILAIYEIGDRTEINLLVGMRQHGVEVHAICHPDCFNHDLLRDAGVPVTSMAIRNRLDFKAAWRLRKILKQGDFDGIYAPNSRGLAASLFASRGLDLGIVTYRGTLGNLSKLSPESWIAHLNPRVDAIVANCSAVERYLLSLGLPSGKVHRIYKGHDVNWYQSDQKVDLSQFGILQDSFVIGLFANLRPLKGTDVLMKAIAKLSDQPHVHALLVGENRDDRLLPLCEKLNLEKQIHFLGYQSDVAPLINACDITVMPSTRREGVARAVIESLSQKVPVIVSDVGGLPEVIQNMKSGLVVHAGDEQALSSAIQYFLDNPTSISEFGAEGLRFVEEELSPEKHVRGLMAVFDKVLDGRSR